MPIFYFSIRNDEHGVCNDGAEFPDRDTAWKEMTGACSDMFADVSRKLVENAEWQMELLDESGQPVSRIRVVAESLDQTGALATASTK
jgi:hypothetical protein